MRPGARVQAAIEVLEDIGARHVPATRALAEWGRTHRFAGSGDRAAIGNLVFDALRRRVSTAWRMGEDSPRALALGVMAFDWGESADAVAAMCDGSRHAPPSLTEDERARLETALDVKAHDWVRGDYPEWLDPSMKRAFGERASAEGAALAARAPVDLRVNTLKVTRDKALKYLRKFDPVATPYSPVGIRIAPSEGPGRNPHLEADPTHGRGWFEVQDEASQLAALLTGAAAGQQVADLCAGAGGKTLALAAAMENRGQIYAWDAQARRLRPIFERLKRAGARNVQVLRPGETEELESLSGRMDVVVVDAPCSGSGAWRRRPDAKWRLRPEMLEKRRAEQREALDQAAPLVKSGGRLAYLTCSVLPEENNDQAAAFRERHPDFSLVPWRDMWRRIIGTEPPAPADGRDDTLLLTPATHGADGFFVAVLEKSIHR